MENEPDFYELLQVDKRASQEVIEAAYQRLARKFHPDLNKSPDAVLIMQRLNHAYQTLRDPQRRAEYDRKVFGRAGHSEKSRTSEESRSEPQPQPIVCEGCGKLDETLRATVFQYVVSVLIVSFKRGGGAGILCSNCRLSRAISYSIGSLLLGPWGLPWGLLWTIEALAANFSGGRQPKDVNGPLLRSLGAYLWSVGMKRQAVLALEASLHFEDIPDIKETVSRLRNSIAMPESPKWQFSISTLLAAAFGVVALGLLAWFAGNFVSLSPNTSPPPSPSVPTSENPLARMTRIANQKMWVCNGAQVKVYTAPEDGAPAVKWFDITDSDWEVSVFGRIGDWYYIGYNEQKGDQFINRANLCVTRPTPIARRISDEGQMKDGLRIGNVEWNTLGYSLVNYAKQMEVQMLFHNKHLYASEYLTLDFRMLVDDQEITSNSMQIANMNTHDWTYYNVRDIAQATRQGIGPDEYLLVILTGNAPSVCATAGEQKDECMRQRKVFVRWLEYKITDRIWLYR